MASPMLDHFQGKSNITSAEFLQIFKKYDKDGNGSIEKNELDSLLKDIIKQKGDDGCKLEVYKKNLLKSYDRNGDGKISLQELSKVLPTAENFLLQFRNAKDLHTVDFMTIWYHYDADRSGYLESHELKGFLHDLLGNKSADGSEVTVSKIEQYTSHIMELFDCNKDGKIELSELANNICVVSGIRRLGRKIQFQVEYLIMPLRDNFLQQFKGEVRLKNTPMDFQNSPLFERSGLSNQEFEALFQHYDQDNNGYIEDTELMAFLRDLLEKKDMNPTTSDLEQHRTCILEICDKDNDGRLNKSELRVLLSRD